MVFTLSDKREVQGTDTSITGGTPNYQWGTTGNMADNQPLLSSCIPQKENEENSVEQGYLIL